MSSMRDTDFVDKTYEGNDISNLNKLTLVIPTYNRNYYLSRCLWYHAHFPFGQIIVADSSPEEKKTVNRLTVEKIRALFHSNILYLEYEPETDIYGGDIYQKWGNAVLHVETEYSIICIDKSFLNIVSLLQKLEFLENHDDYESVQGAWYMMEVIKERNIVCKYPRDYYPPNDSDNEDVLVRYNNALLSKGSFNNQLFSLFRSNTHKAIYQPIVEKLIYDVRYGELALSLLPLVNGKHKHFPEHMDLIRDVTMVETTKGRDKSQSSSLRYPSRLAYAELGILDEYYQRFEDGVINQFHQVGVTDSDEEVRDSTRNAYYDPVAHPGLNLKAFVLRKKWLKEIWDGLPFWLRQIIFRRLGYYYDTEKTIENEFTELIKEILVQFPQTEGDKSIV